MALSEKQETWRRAHNTRAEAITLQMPGDKPGHVNDVGGVRLSYGDSGVSYVQSPAGAWYEYEDEKYETLSDALSAHGIE